MEIDIKSEIILPNVEEVLVDYEFVRVKQEQDLKIECEEFMGDVKQEEDIKIEYEKPVEKEPIIENECYENYDDLANESYAEDDYEDPDETSSEKSDPGDRHKGSLDSKLQV